MRTAAMHDDRLERLEAFVVSPGNKKQLGNSIVYYTVVCTSFVDILPL